MTMRLFNTLSIKHKIITSTLVICSLVIFLSYCVLIALELISFRKSMVNNMTSLASVVGINSTAALTFGDNETAMEILNALSTEPYIRTGCIYNQKGVLFAEYHSETGPLNKRFIPPRLLMLLPTHKSYDKSHFVFSTHHLDIFNPIRLGGKPIGTVFIRADLGHFYKKLIWSVAVLMVGMVGGLLLAFLMSYTLQKMIGEPIENLAAIMKNVSLEKNYSMRAHKKSDDELGVLTDGFNEMLSQIQARDESLTDHRKRLSEQVSLRTLELKESEKQKRQLMFQQKIQETHGQIVSLFNSIDIGRIIKKSLSQIIAKTSVVWGAFYLSIGNEDHILHTKHFFSESRLDLSQDLNNIILKKIQSHVEQAYVLQEEEEISVNIFSGKGPDIPLMGTVYPLSFQKKKIGVIVLASKYRFSSWTAQFLKNVIRQLGVSIHNAMTFQELRDKSGELKKSNEELARASQMKSDFLANMSHELRTPLNAIIGFSEILADEQFGVLNDTQEEYIRDILTSGKHLLSLINDILDLSKVEAGKTELKPSKVNLMNLLQSSAMIIRDKALKMDIKLTVKTSENLPETFYADERKIKQVLYNLLSNAVKFTPSGGIIAISSDLITEKELDSLIPKEFKSEKFINTDPKKQQFIMVSVEDMGIGIRPESHKRIFESFQQEESSHSKKYEGTGLGLAMCRTLILLHRGGIWLESKPGKGSRFTFVLPATQKAEFICRKTESKDEKNLENIEDKEKSIIEMPQ